MKHLGPVSPPEPLLTRLCPVLRALLKKLGGLFLPPEANLSMDSSDGILSRAVVRAVSVPCGYVWGGPRVQESASNLASMLTLPLF